MSKPIKNTISLILLLALNNASFASAGHNDHGQEKQLIQLSATQMQLAGIKVTPLYLKKIANSIVAPGEVVLNSYKTAIVTPRITAQILKRFVKLGDTVKKGTPLLALSSVQMLNAQGQLQSSSLEWYRVKKLGKKVVSAQRYSEANIAFEQAKNQVLAYGMTKKQLNNFLKEKSAAKAKGNFQLLAPQNGTVIFDDFLLGELVQPGKKLVKISDESEIWVEAKLSPDQVGKVKKGSLAMVVIGQQSYQGKVIQIHHTLDEATRTLGVRLEIENKKDHLHPGLFVQVSIKSQQQQMALFVPLSAVLRNQNGDWVIYKEHKQGEFEPKKITLVRTVGDKAVITGVNEGDRVVTKGAFFVQSELAKSGFEVHNH